MVSRNHNGDLRIDLTEGATRVLLISERFLLLDSLRLALEVNHMDVAVTNLEKRAIEDAVGAFNPQVIVFDASNALIESATRSIRSLVEVGRIVVGITADEVSVEAARLIGAGASYVLGLNTALDSFAASINRAMSGKDALPLERRYVLEQLLREYRTTEQRRWLPFAELTERERDIFALVYQGLSADQIAEDACVSISTVRSHIRSILNKLNVHSQLAAVAMARSNAWFGQDSVRTAV